jgi:hypothetical protein
MSVPMILMLITKEAYSNTIPRYIIPIGINHFNISNTDSVFNPNCVFESILQLEQSVLQSQKKATLFKIAFLILFKI